ncbi:Fe3+/spermidine/putrescine ABC transporter ATP-binding protein [Tabrizicola sp. TH137]|uniref:ABC transporter ATP-binding protein n=1 Tax=Tabrizicola sp. TH137 TaxID=2067452 RepID=UPI000C7DA514|nr:ABC transporter ATP-binding protein [Tabrizicola sp. TH137]PLL10481.1 Fe3+/spermidine/putrescine ABC transporter ATP-binding protein [Tabrizicola sp. TH137]
MSFITFQGIRKAYGTVNPVVAVENLDLTIDAGEFMTLLGPSGSGKTTTLMMLAGFEQPTSGAILFEGRHIETLPAYARNMGVVFQSYSLFPHMTVAQNVAFPLEMRKTPRAEIRTRVSAALSKVRLERHADRRPVQLSGGEQQRVALARALVFEPRLVLMDEPLSALDKNLREELQLEIRRLHRELGVTMVFVTHDQSEAMTLSDRITVFNRGRIAQLGKPSSLYDAPENAFVAGFIGDNNRADGDVAQISEDGNSATLRCGHTSLHGRAHPGKLGSGRSGILCVRPEALILSTETENVKRDSTLVARIIDIIHQGDHWRIQLAPDLGTPSPNWMAKCQPGQVPAGLQIGMNVTVGFDQKDAWVLEPGI